MSKVIHPSHYNAGKIEVWDFIADQGLDFDLGNAIKYICRAGKKDSETTLDDLNKAANYIQHEIQVIISKEENKYENH